MDLVDIIAKMRIQVPVDFEQRLSTQGTGWLSTIRDTSLSLANIELIALAVFIVIAAIGVRWIAAHPDQFRRFIRRLRERPWLVRIETLYRGWIEFLVCRFNTEGAYGLSFTASLVTLGLSIWVLSSVVHGVVAHQEPTYFNSLILAYFSGHRTGWLNPVIHELRILGNGWVVLSLATAIAVFRVHKTKSWHSLLLLAAIVLGAGFLDYVFSATVVQRRLFSVEGIVPPIVHTFPSGNTTLSSSYAALGYFIAKTCRQWQVKVGVWTTAITIVFLVELSHVYLGLHWPTDVIGGWALAALWLSVLFATSSVIEETRNTDCAPILKLPENSPLQDSCSQPSPAAMSRLFVSGSGGLSESQVKERIDRGQTNVTKRQTSRSVAQILKANVFTRFNALLGVLWVIILLVGPLQDALFGVILIVNTAIGIIQELRAKRTLDNLVLITAPRARVVRSDQVREVTLDRIVVDDIIELRSGDQVPVDGLVLRSDNAEVDESLLTGESDPVTKEMGDALYSSSFLVAGTCRIQAVCVGEQAYARRLANAARRFELSHSELREGINLILRYITWFLVPTALLLFVTQILNSQSGWANAVVGSVAGVVGMVPEGLVLLTSVVMAVAVIRLARRNALVQELAAVEVLARVDVLCLDKTGTLTEGKMVLEQIIPVQTILGKTFIELPCDAKEALGALAGAESNPNASLIAIAAACAAPCEDSWTVTSAVPFSSARQWSAITFNSYGTWVLGAPRIILGRLDSESLLWTEVNEHARNGKRVLALAYTRDSLSSSRGSQSISLPMLTPAALVILGEHLREDVQQTLDYFRDQGVAIKVISGDNPHTVAAIAAKAGVDGSDFFQDGRDLPSDPGTLGSALEECNVFGRVTPDQKRLMVKAFQARGHVVAMIGDGVNDVLAIKDADFGIAMGSGADASRAIAQLILLTNDFSVLPGVISEGRRIIANIERTANLFLTKTAYVFALALAVGVAQVPFPFLPRHLTLVGFLTIGTPALFLSFLPNNARARRGFVSRVLHRAIPAGGFAAATTLIVYALARQIVPTDVCLARTAATLTLVGCGFSVLVLLARPVMPWQRLFISALFVALCVIITNPWLRTFFALALPPLYVWALTATLVTAYFLGLKANWR